jgi:hypothetical protein
MASLRLIPLPFTAVFVAATLGMGACHGADAGSDSVSGSSAPRSGNRQVQIIDPGLNMVAYTLTIPSGWNFQGAVYTNPTCGSNPTVVAYRVWSDDLQYGVQRMPEVAWDTKQDPRAIVAPMCKQMEAMSAAAYAGVVVPTIRPNATMESIGPAPEAASIAAGQAQIQKQISAMDATYHMQAPTFGSDAARLRISYNLGSAPEEEFLDVMETTADTPSSIIVSRPGQVLRTGSVIVKTTTAWIVAERAPKGKLDASEKQLEAIRTSLTINPAWNQKMSDIIRQKGAAFIAQSWKTFNANYQANAANFAAMHARGEAFIANMQAQGAARNAQFQQYENSRSAATADKVDQILDQQYYVNPASGQTSTISTAYTNNWSSGGTTIQTNLQGYDPNGTVPGNWTQLQPIKH